VRFFTRELAAVCASHVRQVDNVYGFTDVTPGSMIAAVTNDATLYVYTSDLNLRLKRKDCHNLPSTSLAFSPDDSALMSASADKSVVLVPLRPSPSATSGWCCADCVYAVWGR